MPLKQVLNNTSNKLRPKGTTGGFTDEYDNAKRRTIFIVLVILFIGVIAGLLIYHILVPGVVSGEYKQEELTPDKIRELFELEEEGEIDSVFCSCKKYPKLWEINLGWTQDAYDAATSDCNDGTPATDLATELCLGRSDWLQNDFESYRLISADLLPPEEFTDELSFTLSDLCDEYRYKQRAVMYDNAAYVDVSGGNASFAEEGGDGTNYFDAIDRDFTSDNITCEIEALNLDLATGWEAYVDYCEVPKCTWIEDEGFFDILLAWFALVGSIWTATIVVGTMIYAITNRGKISMSDVAKLGAMGSGGEGGEGGDEEDPDDDEDQEEEEEKEEKEKKEKKENNKKKGGKKGGRKNDSDDSDDEDSEDEDEDEDEDSEEPSEESSSFEQKKKKKKSKK